MSYVYTKNNKYNMFCLFILKSNNNSELTLAPKSKLPKL